MATTTIFISYRREDTVGHAGRLFDRLAERFGREHVYRDIDTIAAGEDFVEAVRQKIKQSDVLLALIGPRWLTAADKEGRWRLADENDLVRVEIALALESNIRVIPVLMQGAGMPMAKDLPGELARLAQRSAIEIRDTAFDQDLAQLIEVLGPTWRHKLVRVFARRPVYAAIVILLATLFGLWVYPQIALTPDRARIQIVQMGLVYDANTFVERAKDNDAQAVHLFLRAGMAPDAEDEHAQTAMMLAAANGHLALVKTLAEKGADEGKALLWAAGRGQREVLSFLLARQPSKNAISAAMYNAADTRHTDIMQTLLDKGAEVNFKREDGSTALNEAAWGLNAETVRLLLSRGANVNSTREDGWTPLHQAIDPAKPNYGEEDVRDQMAIIRALLNKGADIHARAKFMQTEPTPLLLAIHKRRPQIALLLIEQGADVNAQAKNSPGSSSFTVLMWAAQNGLTEVVPVLLAKGAQVDVTNELGQTALLIAAGERNEGQPAVIQTLLAAGADVNARSNHGETALIRAAGANNGVLPILVKKGAQINAANNEGRTALMNAAYSGELENVRTLLANGAKTDLKDDEGQDALAIATKEGNQKTVKALSRR